MTEPRERPVPPERLRASFDPATLTFECTDELAPLSEFVGQDRAIRSLEFGLGLHKPGYNIFVTGLTGTGKATAILDYIQRQVERHPDVHDIRDWIYVYNFDDPDQPNAISVPKGVGRRLRDHLEALLNAIRGNISQAFSSEEYGRQRRDTFEGGQRQAQAIIEDAQRKTEAAGFQLTFTPQGPVILPLKDKRPLTADEFGALSLDEKHALAEQQRPVEHLVEEAGEQLRAIERQASQTIQAMDRAVVESIVKAPFDALGRDFAQYEEAGVFLAQLREYTLKSADVLRQIAAAPAPASDAAPPGMMPLDPFLAFRINLFVDNADTNGPPIIIEPNPTWTNLFGRIDRRAYFGTYLSDHTMLKPGAAHRANGGYLILAWNDVATRPAAWDGVKRMIRANQVRLEDPAEQYGLLSPQTLRPEPIPVDLKLVVAGDALAYIMLSAYDEEFWELFKVKADFDHQIPRTPDNIEAYAGFACAVCEREKLRHFDRSAVARLIEYGSRAVEDQQKLSARFGRIRDIIIEADHWAAIDGDKRVYAKHVDQAIAERVYRSNLLEERVREMIARGTFLIDTQGEVVGQVNGLAVLDFGDLRFGRPTRITARTYLGQRGVVSIDRESQLSGKIHDKGVLILSGYLGWQYGQEHPLSLSATISFEQGYDTIDGDSASCAETCAILSALAEAPIRQDLAITGSVNQKGEVQAIGGANSKIEGFFDVCKAIGFTGQQGVILPAANVQNLMLREDVVQAVRDGQFHIYEVSSVDEALEVLTGVAAGEKQDDGTYPEGSLHARVLAKLQEMGEAMRRLGPTSIPPATTMPHEPAPAGKPPAPPEPPKNEAS
ncbi:MAG: ATP-binding protein [Chloroflexota bacterium]